MFLSTWGSGDPFTSVHPALLHVKECKERGLLATKYLKFEILLKKGSTEVPEHIMEKGIR